MVVLSAWLTIESKFLWALNLYGFAELLASRVGFTLTLGETEGSIVGSIDGVGVTSIIVSIVGTAVGSSEG